MTNKKQWCTWGVWSGLSIGLLGTAAAGTVVLSDQPLVGVAQSYGPNVVLALSVEYPTAGAAYSTSTLTADMLKTQYRGYFDNTKCYKYSGDADSFSSAGYFYPSSVAVNENGYYGLCNNGGTTDEFSGNLLNFMTMSAIDVFRSVMTGGNRAKGIGTTVSDYQNGDTVSATYLRRANAVSGKNAFTKTVDGSTFAPTGSAPISLNRVVPTSIGSATSSDSWTSCNGISMNDKKDHTQTAIINKLTFNNSKFGTQIVRQLRQIVDGNYSDKKSCNVTLDAMPVYQDIVKVCDKSVGLENNCVAYGSNYKPEGLLQQYASEGMRVAAMGYLNKNDNEVDGGVLRARMKQLNTTQTVTTHNGSTVILNPEWNSSTGQFVVNPDTQDAAGTNVTNSGVMNYLNKFGDYSGYKTYDPGAELYYTALRYLRNGAWAAGATKGDGTAPYQIQLTSAYADGFPVIYDWDDPLKVNGSLDAAQCRANSIFYIGDTNTHQDWNLPNFNASDVTNVTNVNYPSKVTGSASLGSSDSIDTETALKQAYAFQQQEAGSALSWSVMQSTNYVDSVWSDWSPEGMLGLAYWARTHDLRPDISGYQYGNNFMIDVVESGDYKGGSAANVRNPFYLAAKYGGFDRSYLSGGASDYLNPNSNRSSWTDDASGSTSISAFSDGVPRNFAIANNPDAMTTALQTAMKQVAGSSSMSQTAAGTVDTSTQSINLDDSSNYVLVSQFNGNNWSGDLVAERLSTATSSSGSTTGLTYTEIWSLGTLLTNSYHNGSGYAARNVYAWDSSSNQALRFNTGNDSAFSDAITGSGTGVDVDGIINYTLGDNSNEESEGGTYRTRTNILGTIVNSQAASFTDQNGNRYFAVASNDGMLHIVSSSGAEKLAFLPSTALAGLSYYASPAYSHRFLNDGTPAVAALTDSSGNETTYLVGITGRGDSAVSGGGSSVYVLNVSDLSSPGASNIVWQYTDSDLHHILGKPVITKDKAGNFLAIVGSGYRTSSESGTDKGYLYVLNLTKKTATKIALGSAGVGAVFGFDSDNDGSVDRIYAGDEDGKMWRVDNTSGTTWQVAYNGSPMYTPDSGDARPITGTPYAQSVGGQVYVLAGTGQYFSSADLDTAQQNYAYGFFDNYSTSCTSTSTATSCQPITENDLLKQTIGTNTAWTNSSSGLSLYSLSSNQLSSSNRGWQIALHQGQLIAGAAYLYSNRLAGFTVVSASSDSSSCTVSGSTGTLLANVTNGGQYATPLFDTNGDGTVDSSDTSGSLLMSSSTLNPEGGALVTTSSGTFTSASVGNIKAITISSKEYVKRLSWREIFTSD